MTGPIALSRRQTNIVLTTIALGMLMAALDATIVSTALPTIVADLGGSGHMAWVVAAYVLAEAISTVLAGKFGDLFGRKLVFQVSAVVFVCGSVLSGVANSMLVLIVARAIQGIGGGGVMVTAMALIADVIPLRERGKYQGALGAVFGVATVLGPMAGGLFTDYVSWRWCFYVNLPIAAVMIAIAARAIPTVRTSGRPTIDYAGIALVALGASALILALEWAGSEYAWDSGMIIGLFAGSAAFLAAFVLVELRAREPMLPMSLFRDRVFTVCAILSFVVGFAMYGAITYLPTYLQYVDGTSATGSGLRMLPFIAGLLGTSTLSGGVVSSTGHYRVFPIAGMATLSLALYLLSTMGSATGIWLESAYMFAIGCGIGLAMQVLTIVVQNTVAYAQLGTATSGVTFFRTIGGAVGTAVFGTLYDNRLGTALSDALAASPGVSAAAAEDPSALHALSADEAAPIIEAYADTITYVFLWVLPVALAGFLIAWFLREVPLRDSSRAAASDIGEGFSAPDSPDRVKQLERAIATVFAKVEDKNALGKAIVAASESALSPAQAWALGEIHWRTRVGRETTLSGVADAHWVPGEVLRPAFADVARAGYAEFDDDRLALTAAGRAELDLLHASWRRWLGTRLDDWKPADSDDRALLERALDNIAVQILDEQQFRLEAAPV